MRLAFAAGAISPDGVIVDTTHEPHGVDAGDIVEWNKQPGKDHYGEMMRLGAVDERHRELGQQRRPGVARRSQRGDRAPPPSAQPGTPAAATATQVPSPVQPDIPAGGLPATGTDTSGVLLAALSLVALGAGLVVLRRTRRRGDQPVDQASPLP